MTVVVAFQCTDGAVIAADSMLTTYSGGIAVGHHKGKKIYTLSGNQIFAFAGDPGQANRFHHLADNKAGEILTANDPLGYGISVCQAVIQQFISTGIQNAINLQTALAFPKDNVANCCIYETNLQPRFLDSDHFYIALGSGKQYADPFLRFLVDVFCPSNIQPSLIDAIFLAVWVVEHVIQTNTGGVGGPIRVGILEDTGNGMTARELSDQEIDRQKEAITGALETLNTWRSQVAGEQGPDPDAPPMPKA